MNEWKNKVVQEAVEAKLRPPREGPFPLKVILVGCPNNYRIDYWTLGVLDSWVGSRLEFYSFLSSKKREPSPVVSCQSQKCMNWKGSNWSDPCSKYPGHWHVAVTLHYLLANLQCHLPSFTTKCNSIEASTLHKINAKWGTWIRWKHHLHLQLGFPPTHMENTTKGCLCVPRHDHLSQSMYTTLQVGV